MKKLLTIALVAAAGFAAEGYKVLNKIKIGGAGAWDYAVMDSANRRLYVSHGTSFEILDPDAGKVLGTVKDLQGVHGVALVPEFNKGFISNGRGNNAVIFDLKTFEKTGEVATGRNPDSICYEPKTKRVFAFNGQSNDATAIDAKTNAVVGTVAVGPKPEYCAADGNGKMYVNIENASEVVEIDAAKPEVTRRASLAPCESPSGLAIDTKDKVLFSVCGNKMMAVTDIGGMKVIATPAIGTGPDAAGFDPGTGLAFSSNGQGTLTIVKQVNGKWEPVDTVETERGARTMTVDEKTHRVYLLAAEYGPAPEPPKDGQKKGGRTPPLPDTFHVLVVGK